MLKNFLKDYNPDLASYLIDGFSQGFSLSNASYYPNTSVKNLKSCSYNPQIVTDKLNKEQQAGRVAGPFSQVPLPHFVTSPIGLHPKKEPGQFRLIHDSSQPSGKSVNDGIARDKASVKYQTVEDAVKLIVSAGRGSYLAKSDIKSAFRLIPIHPSEYHLLGFRWLGQYYYDKCLPMGCSSSCRIFESFSTALHWIVQGRICNASVVHVLDDFLFVSPSRADCQAALSEFKHICYLLGVPLAPDKTMGPSQILPFLGITLDTMAMQASLPEDKVIRMMHDTDTLLSQRKLKLKQLQSITGLLNFACNVIVPARAFLRSIFDLTVGILKPYYHITISKQVKLDAGVWRTFLTQYNSKSFLLNYQFKSNQAWHLYTDASTTVGFGAFFGSCWFSGVWHESCSELHISILELYPIYLAIELWGHKLKNQCLMFHCDNISVVYIINKFSSKDQVIMILLRKLVLACLVNNIYIKASHVPGAINVTADMLSRNQVKKARLHRPELAEEPESIPSHLHLHRLLKDSSSS